MYLERDKKLIFFLEVSPLVTVKYWGLHMCDLASRILRSRRIANSKGVTSMTRHRKRTGWSTNTNSSTGFRCRGSKRQPWHHSKRHPAHTLTTTRLMVTAQAVKLTMSELHKTMNQHSNTAIIAWRASCTPWQRSRLDCENFHWGQ